MAETGKQFKQCPRFVFEQELDSFPKHVGMDERAVKVYTERNQSFGI
jgi:hypothetical protein